MNKCHWCGRENELGQPTCTGCGTAFPPEAVIAGELPPVLPPPIPQTFPLTAGRALLVLGMVLLAQMVAALVAGFVGGMVLVVVQGKNVLAQATQEEMTAPLMPVIALFSGVGGGVGLLWAARRFVRDDLWDTRPTGAAWCYGPGKGFAQGVGLGILVALSMGIVLSLSGAQPDRQSLGPLTRMSLTPGLPQILWLTLALVVAPPTEEMLFRGVLYGGLRRSRGPLQAALWTTLIFTSLHLLEFMYFWPGAVGIIAVALAALWFRLRFAAIGPAIGVHLGYNSLVALATVLSPTR